MENQPPRGRDSTPYEEDKSSSRDPLVDALIDAVDALAARVEAVEFRYASLIGVLDRPLSPAESIEELRRLREELP